MTGRLHYGQPRKAAAKLTGAAALMDSRGAVGIGSSPEASLGALDMLPSAYLVSVHVQQLHKAQGCSGIDGQQGRSLRRLEPRGIAGVCWGGGGGGGCFAEMLSLAALSLCISSGRKAHWSCGVNGQGRSRHRLEPIGIAGR